MLYILWRFKLAEELITSLFSQGLRWSIQLQWYTQERKRWIDLSTHTHTHTHTHINTLSLSQASVAFLCLIARQKRTQNVKSKRRYTQAGRDVAGLHFVRLPVALRHGEGMHKARWCGSSLHQPALSAVLRDCRLHSRDGSGTTATRTQRGRGGEVCSRGRRTGEESVNTEKKDLHAIRWPRGHKEFCPTGRHAKWPWEKEWHLFLLSSRGFSTLGSLECP
jgi:hypothetical protein